MFPKRVRAMVLAPPRGRTEPTGRLRYEQNVWGIHAISGILPAELSYFSPAIALGVDPHLLHARRQVSTCIGDGMTLRPTR